MTSSSSTLSSCCISGHLHEGITRGKIVKLYDLDTYVTGSEEDKKRTVVFIADIFGYKLKNAPLLADEIASQGFYVLIPDFFKGDYVSPSILTQIAPRTSDSTPTLVQSTTNQVSAGVQLGPWAIRNREAVARPLVEEFVKELRKDNEVDKIGATGYCWGGRYAILLAHGIVDESSTAVANHPAFLSTPSDLKDIKKPIRIAVGDKDTMFPESDQETTKKFFDEELKEVATEFQVYPNEVHGFAVRGDINNESEKKAKDDSARGTVEWFKKYLA